MKAKKLIYLALPIMLLGVGCSTSTDHLKNSATNETSSIESSSYIESYFALKNDWNKATYTMMNNADDDDIYKGTLNDLKNLTFQFEELEPDSKYEEVHKKIVHTMKTMREGIELTLSNVDDKTHSDYLKGMSTITEAISSHEDALHELVQVKKSHN
ncbi:DUF6376 family protein [Bacillus sp. AFS015896]|uniref:DUF6376 family protein n=1 Tax=Bacillus sp. AFS015896 TaxID=2033487 RepID=UPI000BF4A622|nr:DUF6376 family protein [Bacillus sp. AFS015896]PFA58896.1 hypothetical protein CN402_18795 [Bacillus sp. AFS015896]